MPSIARLFHRPAPLAYGAPSLEDSAYISSTVIYAHLVALLSTPTSLLSWPEEMPTRIYEFLLRVSKQYQKVRGQAGIQALLAVIRHKQLNTSAVAFGDDAELLFYIAFQRVASTYEFRLESRQAMLNLMQRPGSVKARFTRFENFMDGVVRMEEAQEYAAERAERVSALVNYFMVPWLSGVYTDHPDVRARLDMPLSSPLKFGVVPARHEQSTLFPLDTYKLSTDRLPTIVEALEVELEVEVVEEVVAADAISLASSKDSGIDSLFETHEHDADTETDVDDDDADVDCALDDAGESTLFTKHSGSIGCLPPTSGRCVSMESLVTVTPAKRSSSVDSDKTPTLKSCATLMAVSNSLDGPADHYQEDDEDVGATPTMVSGSIFVHRGGLEITTTIIGVPEVDMGMEAVVEMVKAPSSSSLLSRAFYAAKWLWRNVEALVEEGL